MTQPLLVEQHEALSDFLEELLTEEAEPQAAETELEPPTMEETEARPDALPQPLASETAQADDSASQSRLTPPAGELLDAASFEEDGRIPVIPDWGLQAFQAMVFKVCDLSLAVPLPMLEGVVEWRAGAEGGICLGEYQHKGRPVTVIDMARLIFTPGQLADIGRTDARQRVTRIILINEGPYALACDSVHEVLTLPAERVRWRSTRTRRQWLAGTMLEEMMVLLDTDSTAKIISDMIGQAAKG